MTKCILLHPYKRTCVVAYVYVVSMVGFVTVMSITQLASNPFIGMVMNVGPAYLLSDKPNNMI